MKEPNSGSEEAAEHLFRHCSGRILASLLSTYGNRHFEMAEEAVQEAFRKALEHWKTGAVPGRPEAWLHTTARNAMLDSLRRRKTGREKLETLAETTESHMVPAAPDSIDHDATLPEGRAGMLLLCCNPDIGGKAQVCLTLKCVCGFSVREIARVVGMSDEAVKKSLTRARSVVAEDPSTLHEIDQVRVAGRMSYVFESLYALFTEGYSATSGASPIRRDVAEEAICLAGELDGSGLVPTDRRGDLAALTALMMLQFARFDGRIDSEGMPVRLEDQDRSRWDRSLIRAGLDALASSTSASSGGVYHIEARIAAEHALAPDHASTNWETILSLYGHLISLKDTPQTRLAGIVAIRHASGASQALAEMESQRDMLPVNTFLFHAVRADMLESVDRGDAAGEEWRVAKSLAPTLAERRYIEKKCEMFPPNVPDLPSRSSE